MASVATYNNPTLIQMSGDVRTPSIDLSQGGQQGMLQNPMLWGNNANYIRQKTIPVLVSAPRLMGLLSNAGYRMAALKSLMELMPQKIDGLKSSLSADYDGQAVGHAGEKMESVTHVAREVSAPNYEWVDKYGMAITRYWTDYMRMFIADPDLQVPAIIQTPEYINAGSPPITPESQSMVMLFIEPDVTMTNVTNAWLCTNMMPRTAGEIIGVREMGGSNEIPTVGIEFTALTFIGKPVELLAASYLASLKLTDLRPLDLAQKYSQNGSPGGVNSDVLAAGAGFAQEIVNTVVNG